MPTTTPPVSAPPDSQPDALTIRPPLIVPLRLRANEDGDNRHSTWTQNFYDLVYAVTVVVGDLRDDPTIGTVVVILLFNALFSLAPLLLLGLLVVAMTASLAVLSRTT